MQGKLYTLGGVQSKTVDQYDVETDTWANFFPSLRWSLQHRFSFTFLQHHLRSLENILNFLRGILQHHLRSLENIFFRHCRVAHGVATDGNRIFVTGGSAKANSNFGPGLYEMEMCEVVEGEKPEWQMVGEMGEGRSFLGSVVLDKMVYQIGGCLSEDKSTTEVSFF